MREEQPCACSATTVAHNHVPCNTMYSGWCSTHGRQVLVSPRKHSLVQVRPSRHHRQALLVYLHVRYLVQQVVSAHDQV